jgi:hypothetical protein
MRSNCLFYALRRWKRDGGHLVLQKSRYGWWAHVLWTADFKTFYEFVPVSHAQQRRKIRYGIPPMWYRGYERPFERVQ